jgi:hypothetical protein
MNLRLRTSLENLIDSNLVRQNTIFLRSQKMELAGSVGRDWIRIREVDDNKSSSKNQIPDSLLREWRDYLEEQMKNLLSIEADLIIGERTRFAFIEPSQSHTIVEIEAFARKALDKFLDNLANRK